MSASFLKCLAKFYNSKKCAVYLQMAKLKLYLLSKGKRHSWPTRFVSYTMSASGVSYIYWIIRQISCNFNLWDYLMCETRNILVFNLIHNLTFSSSIIFIGNTKQNCTHVERWPNFYHCWSKNIYIQNNTNDDTAQSSFPQINTYVHFFR